MLFRFRDKAYAAHGFGTHVVYALRRSAFRTTVHQPRGCQFAVLDEADSLRLFDQALEAFRLQSRSSYPQHENLRWALDNSGSVLIAFVRSEIEYMTSADEYEFEPLLRNPEQLDRYLREFRGVSSKPRRGNLTLVNSA
jgi:hypothetical protein